MLIAVDIGNSAIKFGFFDGPALIGKLRLQPYPSATAASCQDKIQAFLAEKNIAASFDGAVLSSVVPEITGILNESMKGLCMGEPLNVSASLDSGLTLDIENPLELGPDRLANVVAAREAYGSRVLAVDFGTTTTISAVKDNRYIGGAILPGLELMAEALYRGASRLPQLDVVRAFEKQDTQIHALGKDTTKCMLSGIIYGTSGAVERLISGIENEEGCSFSIIITGGNSEIMKHFLKRAFCHEPDLTLNGLRLIYERQKQCMN